MESESPCPTPVRIFDANYRNKVILAPMGTLPFRLLALQYGCDIAYVEEIIDRKIIACTRQENAELGTVDFVKDNAVVFRTCAQDHPIAFQIGTADPVLALKAAEAVARDVDAIDVNMGCPKHFSVSGGMGSALLSKPQTVKEILTTLVRNVDRPITCKIRLKDRMQDTLDLVRVIESTGVRALAVHARRVAERPKDKARWEEISDIVKSGLSIPLILNGDCFSYADVARAKAATGADSVMIARGAMWNASIFRPEGFLPLEDVMHEYLRKCVLVDNAWQNTKYVMQEVMIANKVHDTPRFQRVVQAKSLRDFCVAFDMEADYDAIVRARNTRGYVGQSSAAAPASPTQDPTAESAAPRCELTFSSDPEASSSVPLKKQRRDNSPA